MLPLVFIGDPAMLAWLSGEFQEQGRSPEDLLIEIEEALESGLITPEQLQELINAFA